MLIKGTKFSSGNKRESITLQEILSFFLFQEGISFKEEACRRHSSDVRRSSREWKNDIFTRGTSRAEPIIYSDREPSVHFLLLVPHLWNFRSRFKSHSPFLRRFLYRLGLSFEIQISLLRPVPEAKSARRQAEVKTISIEEETVSIGGKE